MRRKIKKFIKPIIQFAIILIVGSLIILGTTKLVKNTPIEIKIPEQKITIDCKIQSQWQGFIIRQCLDEFGKNCVAIPITCYGQECHLDYVRIDIETQFRELTKSICN
jgi:Na+-transporting NADH:ubiquinone oxidoreductase subunit NqrF